MQIVDLIKQLDSTSRRYHNKLKEMETKYPNLAKNDARFTFFHKCMGVFDSIILLKITRKYYITKEEFFKEHKDAITIREGLEEQFLAEHGHQYNWENEDEKKYGHFYNLLTNEIDSFTGFTFFHGIFDAFESTLRLLYPKIKGKSTPDIFANILSELQTDLQLVQYEEFFKILRNLRNSIHNNGVHTKNNIELEWSGFQYKFVNDKPIDLKDLWDRWFSIVNTLEKIIENIFTNTKTIETVEDPMVIQKAILSSNP